MELMTAAEIAGICEKTPRAINKRAKKEEWAHEVEAGRGGKKKVYVVDRLPEDVRVLIYKERAGVVHKGRADTQVRPYKAGGAGQRTEGGGRKAGDGGRKTEDRGQRAVRVYRGDGVGGGDAAYNSDQVGIAMAKADLLRIYLQHLNRARWGGKVEARKEFIRAYNSGQAWPELFEKIGKVSWKTIEGWRKTLRENGGDTLALADRRGYVKRGQATLSDEQKEILLKCALHPNAPLVSEVIRTARAVMRTQNILNGHSDATYRRFLDQWKSRNHHIWTFTRHGAKAWNDECAYYIERDMSLIEVGDILVADGHVLNFEILNPWTGKPKRMTLIVWQDMKSSMPCGWEIMPTENTQAIAAAFRRAVLALGKYPKVAYLDNGKAFGSRFFSADLEQAGFEGLFARLGVKTIFAWPYHGQSKPVERFFGSFAELERLCPTYTGTSIATKPPRLMRAEKLHKKAWDVMTDGKCLTIEQAHRAIAAWFTQWASRPSRGYLDGQCPADVFALGAGDGVDPAELRYLMLSREVKSIGRNGINFLGRHYYAPALYGRRHKVEIRYDLADRSSVFVIEPETGDLLCEAFPVEKVHPAAGILGEDADVEKLQEQVRFKRNQEREAGAIVRRVLEDDVIPAHRKLMDEMTEDGRAEDGGRKTEDGRRRAEDGGRKAAGGRRQSDEQIRAELKQITAEPWQPGEGEDDGVLELPRAVPEMDENSPAMWERLLNLSEPERYEKLQELDVRGFLIPAHLQAFMTYFERTPSYERDADYYEQKRAELVFEWQKDGSCEL